MWTRLDDELIDHRKIFQAGELLGDDGPVKALGFYALVLLWTNKHLTDGVIPYPVLRKFPHVADPCAVADALTTAGLLEKNGVGYVVHDFAEFGNPSASSVKAQRLRDRRRKKVGRKK